MPAKRTSRYVNRANKAQASQLAEGLPTTVGLKGTMHTVGLKLASELTAQERKAIWNIEETNMRDLTSNSSMGWDEQQKRQELFDPVTSRFIIVRCSAPNQPAQSADNITAFVMFRFEYDQGERLLYCYEIQIAETWRRSGMGRYLTAHIIQIGRRWKMEKVMLTHLKANTGARHFYSAMGFKKDETSPDYVHEGASDEDVEPCDYEIMSFVL